MPTDQRKRHGGFRPGDILRVYAYSGGFRVWRVTGVYYGAQHQESVVELETLDRAENTQGRMIVPVELLASSLGAELMR